MATAGPISRRSFRRFSITLIRPRWRDPLADSYVTDKIKSGGMHARPVVGGIFIKMLSDRAIWKKWASADKQKVGPWAELPAPPQVTVVVPTARKHLCSGGTRLEAGGGLDEA